MPNRRMAPRGPGMKTTDTNVSESVSGSNDNASSKSSRTNSILQACSSKDLAALQSLAGSEDGFVDDTIRQRVWPILLGSANTTPVGNDWKTLPHHPDEHQISLDVNRAFVYYPSNESESQLSARRSALTELIVSTLRSHPSLSYFQGYHDVAQVLLLVLGLEAAQAALPRLSLLRIRDFMLPSIAGTRAHLDLIPAILSACDPQLTAHLAGLQNYFALSATLTMFAHDVESYGAIARLFDYLLARDAVAGVYMFAALVVLRKDELLDIPPDEPEMLYHVLSKLPKPLNLEALVQEADRLREVHPPERLPWRAWRGVSKCSVLKTTIPLEGLSQQTLEQGEVWLDLRAKEIDREEARRASILKLRKTALRYRRPMSAVLVAVIVGVVSVWLGRNADTASISTAMGVMRKVQQRVMHSLGQAVGRHL